MPPATSQVNSWSRETIASSIYSETCDRLPLTVEPLPLVARRRWSNLPWRLFSNLYRLGCLCVLLAIAASIPILQWASLGYLLEAASRMAKGQPWRKILPGLELAGKIGWIAIAILVTWLPAWLSAQFAYQAELIEPGSILAQRWRMAAIAISLTWIIHVLCALIRGGRWRDFLWPAPLRFFREFFKPATWRRVEDSLWETLIRLQIPRLTWLGLQAWIGALLWLAIPGAMVVIGMQAFQQPSRAAIGVVGFLLMWWVLLYLPFLQIQFATENRWPALFKLSTVRKAFRRAPWAFFMGSLVTLGLAIPLYLLRIESTPEELLWLPCLFFILLTLPAKLSIGWSLNRARQFDKARWWLSRYLAWLLQLAIVPFYILFLYLGSLASWDGALIVFLQHAFLTPAPFVGP